MNILIDTYIVLDLLLERKPYVESATAIFDHIERGTLTGYIAATTITNIFYILRKAKGRDVALASIQRLLIGLQLCAVDRQTVETALNLGLTGFYVPSIAKPLKQPSIWASQALKTASNLPVPAWRSSMRS
ncbi:PIN domain-containing protein [Oscillatoria sp. CS-180]|uniref:type II toxin-antitoxin system VapC family toxin n=1 Tax=Oscillatoria sp. CS-180 TaxID=3021720 RepID=UPI00232D52ED|nr:PIN domain-containing protein [Oscillatoria sp. CS-180]MDB9529460.1 PIN domain-containing protein [Oscillatoria sp. CS-180]